MSADVALAAIVPILADWKQLRKTCRGDWVEWMDGRMAERQAKEVIPLCRRSSQPNSLLVLADVFAVRSVDLVRAGAFRQLLFCGQCGVVWSPRLHGELARLSTMLGLHCGLFVATAAAFAVLVTSVSAWVPSTSSSIAPNPLVVLRASTGQNFEGRNEDTIATGRRDVLRELTSAALAAVAIVPTTASAKCTDDIETCREIGDRKVDEDMKANPTTALPSGVPRYGTRC